MSMKSVTGLVVPKTLNVRFLLGLLESYNSMSKFESSATPSLKRGGANVTF